jgi:outer membrane protein TolC
VIEKGRDVTLAKADQEIAEGALSLARSPYLPSVDLYGSETWLRYEPQALTPAGSFSLSQDRFPTYGFKVTQLVYDFGKTTSSISASWYNVKATDADAARARNRAALDFIVSYLDLLESEKLLQVASDEVKLYEAHLKDTEARYAAGVITRNEVLQAKVTLADSRQRALTAENLRSLRASRLNSLLLRPLTEAVHAEEVGATPSAGFTLADAWQIAEAESPDLKDIDARIRAKEEANSAIRSEYAPAVFVSGGYEYQENRYMVRNDNWTLIAGINLNLFSGGATRAKLHVGAGELWSLTVTRDKILDGVRLDVQRNYLDYQSSLQKVDVTREAVAQAEENLRLQRLRYQEGEGTATDVLDAVTLLTTAQTNAWKALYGVKRAEAGLLYSMGRDLAGAYGK